MAFVTGRPPHRARPVQSFDRSRRAHAPRISGAQVRSARQVTDLTRPKTGIHRMRMMRSSLGAAQPLAQVAQPQPATWGASYGRPCERCGRSYGIGHARPIDHCDLPAPPRTVEKTARWYSLSIGSCRPKLLMVGTLARRSPGCQHCLPRIGEPLMAQRRALRGRSCTGNEPVRADGRLSRRLDAARNRHRHSSTRP